MIVQTQEFQEFLIKFQEASTEEKIDLYCTQVNLSDEQYRTLLRNFPPSELKKLERALS